MIKSSSHVITILFVKIDIPQALVMTINSPARSKRGGYPVHEVSGSGMKNLISTTLGTGIMIRRWGCSGRWTRCGGSIRRCRRMLIVRIIRLGMLIRMEKELLIQTHLMLNHLTRQCTRRILVKIFGTRWIKGKIYLMKLRLVMRLHLIDMV